MHKHAHETPTPPREVERLLPGFLDRAIWKCLEKNPKKRFQSATELEAALAEKAEAKPQAGEEIELPAHLSRWQRSDWWLIGAAIAGLALFFPFFNRTSIAPRSQVTFDRGALRRICEEYAQRLGAPFEGKPHMQAWWVGNPLDYIAQRAGAPTALELTNHPIPDWEWLMLWDNGTEVGVDHQGALVHLRRELSSGSAAGTLSPEDAKSLAEKNLRDFFHPSRLIFESASNVTLNGRPGTSFAWSDPDDYHGLIHGYEVQLVGSQIALLNETYSLPEGYVSALQKEAWQLLPTLAFDLIVVVLGISQRKLVDTRARWRVALVGFVAFGSMYFGMLAGAVGTGPLSLGILVSGFVGLAGGFVAFFFSIAIERSVNRVWPAKLSSLTWLFHRKMISEPFGLAILRGTFIGLGVLGIDALLVWLGTARLGMWPDSATLAGEPARSSMIGTGWSVTSVSTKELFQAAAVALAVAFLVSSFARLVRRRWLALVAGAFLSALILPGPMFNMAGIQPYPAKVAILTLEYALFALALLRFDALTILWAAFTFAFCWANYYLLVMFEPTGALEEWSAFAVFGLFVLAATSVAFKSSLKAAYRRATAVFQ